MQKVTMALSLAAVLLQNAPPRPGVKTPGARIPIDRLKPAAVYEVPGSPDWLAVEHAVWVSNKPKDSVSRLDPTTSAVTAVLPVGRQPCSGLAIGFSSLWVPTCGDRAIARVDLITGRIITTVRVGIGNSEGSIIASDAAIWIITDANGTLSRIDPTTNRVVAQIALPPGSYGLAFGEGAVWATSTDHDSVIRVDPAANRIAATIRVARKPRFIAAGHGGVWALSQAEGSVSRIDPRSNQVVATIDVGVPGPGGDIAVGEGSVWVTSFEFPLSRIDPKTNTVVQQFVGKGGDAVRVGLGSVWLSNFEAGTVWRLDPRRIEAIRPY